MTTSGQYAVKKEYFDKKFEALDRKIEEQTDAIGRMVKEAFDDHQANFLQEQFDRLSAQLSLATELKTVKIDITAILADLQQMKHRVDNLEKHKA